MGKTDKLNVLTHFAEFVESLNDCEVDLIEISKQTPLVSIIESSSGSQIDVYCEIEGRTSAIDVKGLKFGGELELRRYLKDYFGLTQNLAKICIVAMTKGETKPFYVKD